MRLNETYCTRGQRKGGKRTEATPTGIAGHLAEDSIPRAGDLGLDLPVVLFTTLAVVASILLPSILPAWFLPSGNVASSLRQGGGTIGGSRSRNRARSLLLIGEVALSITLLVGAGLLIRSS